MCDKQIRTDKSHLEPDTLIIHPKNITQYPNINIPGMLGAGTDTRRGAGGINPAQIPLGWGWMWKGKIPNPILGPPYPEEVLAVPGWHGKSRARRALQGSWILDHAGRRKGLMQGKDAARQLFGSASIPKVFSWHKTQWRRSFPAEHDEIATYFPKTSQSFCSSCLLRLGKYQNTSIFNLKDILIIYLPF